MNTKRQISLERAKELKSRITDYLAALKFIAKGLELQSQFLERKRFILITF